MQLSIRARIAISFTAIFAALLILFSSVVYLILSSALERKLVEDSQHDMGVLLSNLTKEWDQELKELDDESQEFRLLIRVMTPDGRVVYATRGLAPDAWPDSPEVRAATRENPVWSEIESDNESFLVLSESLTPPGEELHIVQTANPRRDGDWIRQQFIYCVNIGTPLVLLVAGLVGYLFSRRTLTPVERIRRRAEEITSDDLTQRLSYDGPPDELFRLTETLNDLLSRVQRTVDHMKRFIADASHELRIPLAALRGTLEVSLRQDRTKEEYRQVIETAHEESERLTGLVGDLLSLARADAEQMRLEKKVVAVEPFLRAVFHDGEMLNADNRVRLRLGEIPQGTAAFDPVRIQELLINLLQNSIRYNKPGGEVLLSAALTSTSLLIRVKDTGIGLSPDDQKRVFDRFYRVDKARSRDEGGTGLGLAIARSIAEAHNGALSVQSVLGEGSEFTLVLPLH